MATLIECDKCGEVIHEDDSVHWNHCHYCHDDLCPDCSHEFDDIDGYVCSDCAYEVKGGNWLKCVTKHKEPEKKAKRRKSNG